jgi:hypothetical protein
MSLATFHARSNWRGSLQLAFVLPLLARDVALEPESPDAGGVGYPCPLQRIASTAGETTPRPIAGNDEPATLPFPDDRGI